MPEPTTVYIKCRNPKSPPTFKDETITLKGSGEISFQQGCSITLPRGQKFKIPLSMPNRVLKDSQLFNLLQVYPEVTNITIAKVPEKSEELEILEQMELTPWDQFSHDTFHPTKSMPFLTQFFLAVILLVILVGISKCFCRFCNCCQQDSYRIPFVDNTIPRPTAMQNIRMKCSKLKYDILTSCTSCNKPTGEAISTNRRY